MAAAAAARSRSIQLLPASNVWGRQGSTHPQDPEQLPPLALDFLCAVAIAGEQAGPAYIPNEMLQRLPIYHCAHQIVQAIARVLQTPAACRPQERWLHDA